MKKLLLCSILLLMVMIIMAQPRTLPRVYVQKLILENGENPKITWDKKNSAPEYILKAWIAERPKEVLSTDKNPIHSIAIKEVGGNDVMPLTVVINVQLGNFPSQWKEGETLHLELKHKKSKQKLNWSLIIPAGTNLIKFMDEPKVIPPFAKKKK